MDAMKSAHMHNSRHATCGTTLIFITDIVHLYRSSLTTTRHDAIALIDFGAFFATAFPILLPANVQLGSTSVMN
jgi:hypothetical protein